MSSFTPTSSHSKKKYNIDRYWKLESFSNLDVIEQKLRTWMKDNVAESKKSDHGDGDEASRNGVQSSNIEISFSSGSEGDNGTNYWVKMESGPDFQEAGNLINSDLPPLKCS